MKPTIITTQQLADLADLHPSFFTLHRDELPQSFTVPSGPKGGRPQVAYSLEDLAAFILDRTNFLTDAECRLRVAMTSPRIKPASFLEKHFTLNVDGVTRVLPRSLADQSPEERDMTLAAIASDREALRARRCAKARRTRTTPQETQS